MRRLTSFIIGVLLGSLVGTSLAMLFAPSSGEDLRNQVKEYSNKMREEMRQASLDKRIELERQLVELRAPAKPESE